MPGMVPTDVYRLAGAADPCLSPDASQVAFVRWSVDQEANDYRGQIRIAPVDGSASARRLSASPAGRHGQPRFSPDGRRIAFTCSAGQDPAQLYVASVRGGEPRCLTALAESAGELAWSPDGTQIVFSARVQPPALTEQDERRRPPRRITRLQFKLDSVGWTADRRRQLFTVPADGSAPPPRSPTATSSTRSRPGRRMGQRIAFVSARDADWDISTVSDIYVVDAAGGPDPCVTGGDAELRGPGLVAGRERVGPPLLAGRPGQPAPRPDRGGAGRRRRASHTDRGARPHLRPLPVAGPTGLDRRADRVRA